MTAKTMLVVDDNKINRALLANVFKKEYSILEAENGVEAWELLQRYADSIDIVLLDIRMPLMNGYTVIQKMKSEPSLSDIPVVVVSGQDDVESELKVLDLGASDMLVSPFDPRIIKQRVKNIINGRLAEKFKIENALLREQTQAQVQLKAIMDNMVGGVAVIEVVGEDLKAIFLSDGYHKLCSTALSTSGKYKKNFLWDMQQETQAEFIKKFRAGLSSNKPFDIEYNTVNKKGQNLWLQMHGVSIDYPDKENPVIIAVFTDVSGLKTTEQELRDKTVQLTALMQNIPGAVVLFSINENRINAECINEGINELYGITNEEYNNAFFVDYDKKSSYGFLSNQDRDKLIVKFKDAKANEPFDIRYGFKRKEGNIVWTFLRCIHLHTIDDVPYYYGILLDVTNEVDFEDERNAAIKELTYRANYDIATGVYNRRAFFDAVTKKLLTCFDKKFLLIRTNIVQFRSIKEKYGIAFSDMILMEVVSAIKKYADKRKGIYGRLDSDNFALCMAVDDFNADEFLTEFDNSIKDIVSKRKFLINFGVCEFINNKTSVSQVADYANIAIESIKNVFKTRIAYCDDNLRMQIEREQEIVDKMNAALERGEFEFYLQPIVSYGSNKIINAEALARWRTIDRMIPPSEFIPIFERNGFIGTLDEHIFEQVCIYQSERIKNNKKTVPISVNLSRASLSYERLPDEIYETAKKHGVPTDMVKFEVTETAYNDNPEQLVSVVKRLQNYGFTIMMDDFGSGYSSLNTLKDLPIDVLKIDMCFLRDMETNARAGTILTSIVRMTKWLDIPIVAEGVETYNHANFLKNIGCDHMQGYLFSRPIPADEFNLLMDESVKLSIEKDSIVDYRQDTDYDTLFNGNETLAKLLNSIVGGIGLYEYNKGRMEALKVNDGYFEILGNNAFEYYQSSKNVLEWFDKKHRNLLVNAIEKSINSGAATEVEVLRNVTEKKSIWIKVKTSCLSKSEDKALICCWISDITSQKINELKVKENQIFLQNLYSTLPCGIVQWKVTSKSFEQLPLYSYNKKTWEILGYLKESDFIKNKTLCNTLNIAQIDKEVVIKKLSDLTDKNKVISTEVRFKKANSGKIGWLRLSAQIIDDNDTKLLQVNFTDITEEKESAHNKELTKYGQVLFNVFDEICEFNCVNNTSTKIFSKNSSKINLTVALDYSIKTWADTVVNEKYSKRVREFYIDCISGKLDLENNNTIEYTLKNDDNMWHSATMLKLNEGVYLMCIKDISRRKLFELSVKQQLEKVKLRLNRLSSKNYLADKKMILCISNDLERFSKMKPKLMDMYDVKGVDNYCEAYGFVTSQKPDAILMDLDLDFTQGLAFLHKIKNDTSLSGVPVLACTEKTDKETYYKILETGVNDIYEKPLSLDNIVKKLKNILLLCDSNAHNAIINSLINNLPGGIGVVEIGEEIKPLYISPNMAQKFELSVEEFIDTFEGGIQSIISKKTHNNLIEAAKKAQPISTQIPLSFQGRLIWMYLNGNFAYRDNSKAVYYMSVTDVTQLRKQKVLLDRQEEAFKLLLENNAFMMFDYDGVADEMTFYIKDKCSQRMVKKQHQFLERFFETEIIASDSKKEYYNLFKKSLKSLFNGKLEYRADFNGAGYRWYSSTFLSISEEGGRTTRIVGSIEDMEEQKILEKNFGSLKARSEIDKLTDVYNREAIEEKITIFLAKNTQKGIFILFDLDDFKNVNDTYGHSKGDILLNKMAGRLKDIFAGSLMGRVGGDEFVILISNSEDIGYVVHKLRILNDAAGIIAKKSNWKVKCTISAGIVIFDSNSKDYHQLFDKADAAMYCAKNNGKNGFKIV